MSSWWSHRHYRRAPLQAWLEWQELQTMLINEKHLNMMYKAARKYLTERRDQYLAGSTKPRVMSRRRSKVVASQTDKGSSI
jgi:Fe-S cluster biosynthesis and repair protein YggX